MGAALKIAIVSDGKAGHRNQSYGLAEALQRCRPGSEIIELPPLSRGRALRGLLRRETVEGEVHVLIGAGHGTHLSLLALGRAWACPTVVIMGPSLPRRLFSLCIEPRHDGGRESSRRWLSDGPMNRLQVGPLDGDDLLLVGGPSPHYRWDEEAVLAQVRQVAGEGRWQLSTSRRTPDSLRAALGALQMPNLQVHDDRELEPGWLGQTLPKARHCWVTPDSASMVYEALTAGCAVGLMALAPQPGSRVAAAMEDLTQRAIVTPYKDFCAGAALAPMEPPLAEADRMAARLLDAGVV